MNTLTKNSSVLIATFSPWIDGKRLPINGSLEPLVDFFTKKVKKTVLIDQFYPGSDDVMYRVEIYNEKKMLLKKPSTWTNFLKPILKRANKPGTHIVFKLRDIVSVLDVGFKTKEKFDYFVGLEAVNAIAGLLLKKMGKVKTVIYYVSDYSPKRYSSGWFNSLYLSLDRFAAMNADFIWDVSPAMQPARIKAGLDSNKSAPVVIAPNGLYPYQIRQGNAEDIKPFSLVFMGTLGEENGPDLAIKALPSVIKKYPKTLLYIIGGNKADLDRLEKLSKKLKMQKHVVFVGFISDRKKLADTLTSFAIALAPYLSTEGSARWYGDATKIRAYMAAGLPTVTTHVPPLGNEVVKNGAAIMVKDNKEDLAKAINNIFSDSKLFTKLRNNAIKFAKNNTWDNSFENAFLQMDQLQLSDK